MFQNVLKRSTGKTRILVTHALHFLPEVDYIYTLVDGRIAERGTYPELIANDGAFSKFIAEFGSKEDSTKKEQAVEGADTEETTPRKGTAGKAMMQEEERNTGAVKWEVYREYLRAADGTVFLPLLLLSVLFMQGSSIMSSYWYVIFLHPGDIANAGLQACLLARIVRARLISYTCMCSTLHSKWPQPAGFYVSSVVLNCAEHSDDC